MEGRLSAVGEGGNGDRLAQHHNHYTTWLFSTVILCIFKGKTCCEIVAEVCVEENAVTLGAIALRQWMWMVSFELKYKRRGECIYFLASHDWIYKFLEDIYFE